MSSAIKKKTAANISVLDTLKLLDGEFHEVAEGVAKGEYALWLGSGISRERVPDLRIVARRVLDYLSKEARAEADDGPFKRALSKALDYALTTAEKVGVDQSVEPAQWPNVDTIVDRLVGKYALLLDLRIAGKRSDHLVWDIVDVRNTYANDNLEPDCEHIAIAVLALEGVIPKVASANWDGLVEKAAASITNGNQDIVAIMVRADDIPGANGRTHLHKFHGCAVRAKQSEELYREYIVGRDQQITDWPNDPKFALMKNQLDGMSVTYRTLMIGLSAQDSNIKDIFSAGRAMLKRAWPAHPPAYVFAGDELGAEQGTMIKSVYQDDYDNHQEEIEKGAKIPAYGKPLLSALVLSVLSQKLASFIRLANAPLLLAPERKRIADGAMEIRDLIAALAGDSSDDKRNFVNGLVAGITRNLAMFRGDNHALVNRVYGPVGTVPIGQMGNDPNLQNSGMPELAMFVGAVGLGTAVEGWTLTQPVGGPDVGSFSISTPASVAPQKVFVVSNNETVSKLVGEGVLDESDTNTIVAVCSAPVPRRQTNPSATYGRAGKDDAPSGCREFSFKSLVENATGADHLLARLKEEATL
ncbi:MULTISPECIES: SIR2 family protein [unclassified Mesorhizobium]|uniref:SIR2 family protein n=1 Tax=unclassified Mesorhizobium TaxID=325217 RepID=UPI0024150225|nr:MULTISPECIES: SIR2 family protein [unclassified Mesorhizobium]MDG4889986.1 SIR2 family protein [Mesorhizobium sp. WSM4887]MDG4904128.1 SIR2 family protein [Mesorhizobium sp. WSM4962]MDG4909155.1 SIR2 family protein [Mesorhizobium sp. WSM4898]MDG4921779.1 SIR2 family protein [Mesorhizobium sp. WSM4989]